MSEPEVVVDDSLRGEYGFAAPEDQSFVVLRRDAFMAELGVVVPPWDLCGFDRSFDPYSWPSDRTFVLRWLWDGDSSWPSGMSVEEARDPNERDDEWPQLAFMPHVSECVVVLLDLGRIVFVPAYLSVGEALFAERQVRAERRFSRGLGLGQREFWRDAVLAMRDARK